MVYDISDLLLRKNEQQDDRDAIVDMVALPEITQIIRDAGLDPFHFTVNEKSMESFLSKQITDTEEDGALGSVYYDYKTVRTLYRAECRITIGQNQVESDTALYKLENYLQGNREWFFFNGVDWEEGPGKELFDISEWTVNGNA